MIALELRDRYIFPIRSRKAALCCRMRLFMLTMVLILIFAAFAQTGAGLHRFVAHDFCR